MKTNKKNKINVVTLGCSKNIYDSEILLGQLKANHIYAEHESKNGNAKTVIINTCGFIQNAKQESINTILKYAEAKKKGFVDKVYVTGCLSERYKNELKNEIPNIDEYFGTHDLTLLIKTLNADYKHELIGERVLTTPRHFAYFKISEGCDRKCSFCAIPLMRGKHVSIPIEELVKQAKKLARDGTRELILIAQDLTYYGLDIYRKRYLSELLNRLDDVEGLQWIRLHYAFPSGFPMDVLAVMRSKSNICKYFDIPLQHINNRILVSMQRGINKKKTIELIDSIRNQVPGIAIRTTLIAGYPGETENEFDELKEWVIKTKFERLGIFTYSHEEDTKAYKLIDDIPQKVKQKRADEIMEIQSGISLEINRKKIGQTLKVLFDRKEGKHFIGRTEHDSPDVDNEVLVDTRKYFVKIGDFANVKITDASEYDLYGEVVV